MRFFELTKKPTARGLMRFRENIMHRFQRLFLVLGIFTYTQLSKTKNPIRIVE
jgi:hypothetical protein